MNKAEDKKGIQKKDDKQRKAGQQSSPSDRQHSQARKEDPEQSGLTRGGDPKSKE